jgi:hypothetical protein
VTKTGTVITTPNGERVQCESFEAQLHSFESSSIECTSLDDESYADQCGCSDESESFVPCSLCPGGEAVPFPEKMMNGLQGIGLAFIEQTCGSLANTALESHENSQECRWIRLASKL